MKKILFLFISFFIPLSFCCGPFSPPSYLSNNEYGDRETEYSVFVNKKYEMALLGKHFYPDSLQQKFPKHITDKDKVLNMEIKEVFRRYKLNPDDAEKLVKNLQAMHQDSLKNKKPKDISYDSYSADFVYYEKGLYEITENPDVIPPNSWKNILTIRQLYETDYRSTWVLYMTGNLFIGKNPELAHSYYQRLRAKAKEGSRDPLGLAYDSFKTEYMYTPKLKDKLKNALYCFSVYNNLAEKEDAEEVMLNIRQLLKKAKDRIQENDLHEVLSDPICREIILLFGKDFFGDGFSPDDLGTDKLLCADRLAFYAYERGDKKVCMEYLKLSPDNSITKLWLLARFARQEHKYAEAAEHLKKWLELYSNATEEPLVLQNYDIFKMSMKNDVLGMLGSVQVGQRDFSEAIYTFIKANDIDDAICVAERIIDLNELIRFCSNYHNYYIDTALARRLMRASRPEEAMKFFTGNRTVLEIYCALSKKANDLKFSRNERAEAFLKIGLLLSEGRYGKILFGTYFAPDCTDGDGYHFYTNAEIRQRYNSSSEKFPCEYRVSAFFSRAASLTENTDIKVLSLYLGGSFLKHQFPKDADVYYKMICDCRPHPFAKDTFELRWFPKKLPENLQKLHDEIKTSIGIPKLINDNEIQEKDTEEENTDAL